MGLSLSFALAISSAPALGFDPAQPVNQNGKGIIVPPGETPPPDPDPTPPPTTRKLALGVHMPNGRDMGDLDAFTASIGGNTPAVTTVQSAWGNEGTKDFPASTLQKLRDRGIVPMVWWVPIDPSNRNAATYSRHKNISDGLYDDYIHQFAQDAADYGGPVLLRWAHEANSNFFPWSINNHDNSAASYVKAWRHIYNIFQFRGATNVKFVWHIAQKVCSGGCNPYTELYPGDGYVDAMAFSAYNWGDYRGNWVSMYDAYKKVTRLLGDISDKPIIVGETSSNEEGGDKAAWIRDGYREVFDKLPHISAIIWTNADLREAGHPDWRVNSSAASLAAYREIASLDRFQGRKVLSVRKASKIGQRATAKSTKKKAARQRNADATSKFGQRVLKGDVAERTGESAAKKATATGTKARQTRVRKKESEPPQTLDEFSR